MKDKEGRAREIVSKVLGKYSGQAINNVHIWTSFESLIAEALTEARREAFESSAKIVEKISCDYSEEITQRAKEMAAAIRAEGEKA